MSLAGIKPRILYTLFSLNQNIPPTAESALVETWEQLLAKIQDHTKVYVYPQVKMSLTKAVAK